MKVILTGGGTGGHIYPALAIGEKFKERASECELLYIGHTGGMEETIVPNAGVELRTVRAEALRRDNPIKMFRTAIGTLKGRKEALAIMKSFKPDVVVSTGSYVSVPVVLAAHAFGAAIFMHEQNGYPGVSNRMFAKYAKRVFLGFESARAHFKEQNKLIYSGNPVRKDFYDRDKTADRNTLGLNQNDFIITVFGGSLGSETTNKIGKLIIEKYGNKAGFTIIFGTGKYYYDSVIEELKAQGLDELANVRISPYMKEMPEIISSSDLIISRSGALSVAEVTMCGRAAIFVPSSNVTADHQYYNAKAVADNGGAVIVRDSEAAPVEVMKQLDALVSDRTLVKLMEEKSAELAPRRAADIIYEEAVKCL